MYFPQFIPPSKFSPVGQALNPIVKQLLVMKQVVNIAPIGKFGSNVGTVTPKVHITISTSN